MQLLLFSLGTGLSLSCMGFYHLFTFLHYSVGVGDKVALSEWLNLLILIARDTKSCCALLWSY